MREIADQLWQDLAGAADGDFVEWVAKPFPARTIAAVIGAPPQDAVALHEWSGWVQRQFDIRALAEQPERIEQAVGEMQDYVVALLDQRRGAPADDLISALLRAQADGDRLSHAECVNLVLNVLAGEWTRPLPSCRMRCACSRRTRTSGTCSAIGPSLSPAPSIDRKSVV